MTMQRISIVGTTGSGKTTLATALSAQSGYPVTDIDDLYWRPGWQRAEQNEFLESVARAASGEKWYIVGNYRQARTLVWPRADTVVWIDYSFPRTFWQLLRRCIDNILNGNFVCNGNQETLRLFFSRKNIMLWLFQTYGARRRELSGLMSKNKYPGLRFIRLKNPQETSAFIKGRYNA